MTLPEEPGQRRSSVDSCLLEIQVDDSGQQQGERQRSCSRKFIYLALQTGQ